MNLKTLALTVAICQTTQLLISLYNMVVGRYFSPLHLVSVALAVPQILFFFYIWQKQKSGPDTAPQSAPESQ
jgi:hypothetical protein